MLFIFNIQFHYHIYTSVTLNLIQSHFVAFCILKFVFSKTIFNIIILFIPISPKLSINFPKYRMKLVFLSQCCCTAHLIFVINHSDKYKIN